MHRIVIGCDTKKVYNHKEYLYLRKIKYSQLILVLKRLLLDMEWRYIGHRRPACVVGKLL